MLFEIYLILNTLKKNCNCLAVTELDFRCPAIGDEYTTKIKHVQVSVSGALIEPPVQIPEQAKYAQEEEYHNGLTYHIFVAASL